MYKVLQATCQNGRLVLKEKLAPTISAMHWAMPDLILASLASTIVITGAVTANCRRE